MSDAGNSPAVDSPQRSNSPGRRVFSVSELAGGLNALLEDRVGRVWVAGEVSGLSQPRSGHVYFTLKDGHAQLDAALFRQAVSRIPFRLEDGLEVLVYADVQIYAPYVYDSIMVMVEAMKKANSAEPAKYLPELAKIKYKGVTGNIEFDNKGDIKNGTLTLYTYKGGKREQLAVVK